MTILSAVPLYPVVSEQALSLGGLAPIYTAAPTGLTWRRNGESILHVKNGGGSPTVVTIPRGSLADLALSVPAGGERFLGPFPFIEVGPISAAEAADPVNAGLTGLYSDYANASFSVLTSVTYALFGLPLERGPRRNLPTEGGGVGPVVAGTTALIVQPLDAWAANTPTYSAAAAAGNHLSAAGGTDGLGVLPHWFAHVKNAGGSPTTVTVQARGWNLLTGAWSALINSPAAAIVVPAGGECLWTFPDVGRWAPDIRGGNSTYAVLSYSVTTSVTVAVFDARAGWGDQ